MTNSNSVCILPKKVYHTLKSLTMTHIVNFKKILTQIDYFYTNNRKTHNIKMNLLQCLKYITPNFLTWLIPLINFHLEL